MSEHVISAIISVIIIGLLGGGIYVYIRQLLNTTVEEEYEDIYSIKYLTESIKLIFSNKLKQNLKEVNLSKSQLEKLQKAKSELSRSLKQAGYGDQSAMRFVTDQIEQILKTHDSFKLDAANIDRVMPFGKPDYLKSRDRFEILMYLYDKKYSDRSFTELSRQFNLCKAQEDEYGNKFYEITEERIKEVYNEALFEKGRLILTYDDKVKIIARRIFEDYKGFGCIQCLINTRIDEVDIGTSGIAKDSVEVKNIDIKNAVYSHETLWIMYQGKNIHLTCTGFEEYKDLIRVCQNIYKYGAKSTISRNNPKVVSQMKDGSRIVVTRPPLSDSWAAFLRKFDSTPSIAPKDLFKDEGAEYVLTLMKWLILGENTIAISGDQGSGKSTTLKSFIRFFPKSYTIRVVELAFELNLRSTYPDMNIVTLQSTDSVSMKEGLELGKKMNGTVTIVGEAAEAETSSSIINAGMVASKQTLFTHHGKTVRDLISSIRNDLLMVGGFTSETIAEEMVAKVINFDMHMTKGQDGSRYCERITQILPITDRRYPSEVEELDLDEAYKKDTIEYEKRITDRDLYTAVNLIEFVNDEDGRRYEVRALPAKETMDKIMSKLTPELQKQFMEDMKNLEGFIKKPKTA